MKRPDEGNVGSAFPHGGEIDPRWDWDRQELREQVRIGTVLETYDCGYIRVEDTTPDGVISRSIESDRHLWTWRDLKRLECIVYWQPGDSSEPPPPLIEMERGGRLPNASDREPSLLAGDIQLPSDFDARRIDRELVWELTSLIPIDWVGARLEANCGPGKDIQVVVWDLEKKRNSEPSELLTSGVGVLHQLTGRRQYRTWSGLELTVERTDPTGWRYELQFTYQPQV